MHFPTIAGIIVARLDSSRLPGKVLHPLNGIPLIGYVIARARRTQGLSKLLLATTHRPVDDPLVTYAALQGIPIYRGDVDDVAGRVLQGARMVEADYFVRLNGDSPFLDPGLIEHGIAYCQNQQPGDSIDMVTNLIGRTFPYGIAVEIIKTSTFEQVYNQIISEEDREHLTRYMYNHPEIFTIKTITSDHPELSRARLVVDTHTDFEVVRRLVEKLGETAHTAGYEDVASLYLQIAAMQKPSQSTDTMSR